MHDDKADIGQLLETPHLAEALESDRFKRFLDRVPVAIAVAELGPEEKIIYVNLEFERLTGAASDIQSQIWQAVSAHKISGDMEPDAAVTGGRDHVGKFVLDHHGGPTDVDAWSNLIEDDDGKPVFRLVALVETGKPGRDGTDLAQRVAEKDVLLRELQHRVKNNLQMITALIRLEARNLPSEGSGQQFARLAGRVEALALLYQSLSEEGREEVIDLGIYVSQIASAVMRVHAVEGIHLDLQVDTWPVSINVAMPTGLVVNELLTNALKHAFEGRDGGTITLHCLVKGDGCHLTVADDGVGLEPGATWPKPGKLSALIVQSLRQNAKASLDVLSKPGGGMRVTIVFDRADAAPPPIAN